MCLLQAYVYTEFKRFTAYPSLAPFRNTLSVKTTTIPKWQLRNFSNIVQHQFKEKNWENQLVHFTKCEPLVLYMMTDLLKCLEGDAILMSVK